MADFEAKVTSTIVPLITYAAQLTQFIQAEAFNPFWGESDIIANQAAFRLLPGCERVALVQYYVDVALATGRAHFHGLVVGSSA